MERLARRGTVEIGYSIEGPDGAPALLLINSIGATRRMWDRQLSPLSRHLRVVRYDARGHGASSVPAGDYTLQDLGRDALTILDDAGIARAHVCGISLGGLTAMWLGLQAPARVGHLILANTAARIGTADSWAERMAIVRTRGMSAVADIAMPRWLSDGFRQAHPDTAVMLRAMVESCPIDGYLGCCAALRDADLRGAIGAIASPVLAIAGSDDATTTPAALAEITRSIPGATMVTLDAAHLSNVEQADAFTQSVLAFVGAPAA